MPRSNVNRSRGDVVGIIDPQLLYDTQAVMEHAGIGEIKLRELKQKGQLKGYPGPGGRVWYRGQDLIEVILNFEKQKEKT